MPSSVSELFDRAGVEIKGVVPWGKPVPTELSGVYVISTVQDSHSAGGTSFLAPTDKNLIGNWLDFLPQFQLDGQINPNIDDLVKRLQDFWLLDENILYIGKATSLKSRLRCFYSHQLGKRSPHAGGHWMKTLSTLDQTFIHFGEVSDFTNVEAKMLRHFIGNTSDEAKKSLRDPGHPFPFANLAFPPGTSKKHGMENQRLLKAKKL